MGSISPNNRRGSAAAASHGRRGSFTKAVPVERLQVKEFWKKVVMHQVLLYHLDH